MFGCFHSFSFSQCLSLATCTAPGTTQSLLLLHMPSCLVSCAFRSNVVIGCGSPSLVSLASHSQQANTKSQIKSGKQKTEIYSM